MSDASKHIRDYIFFFQEDSALVHMHCACNTVQLLCGALDFLSSEPCPHHPDLNALIIRFRESYSSVWVVSQKDWRNQGATSWILAMHWYSIWVKKMRFSCFPVLPGSAEAQVICGGTVKCLLIVYFMGNTSANNIVMRSRMWKL